MPGWFIHLDVGRDIATRLASTPDGLPGPKNTDLAAIIRKYPNYYALGAIGPDLFFFLPDFKGKLGNFIAKIAEFALEVWDLIDTQIVGPWEAVLGPIGEDNNELVSRLTGDLSEEIGRIANLGTGIIIQAALDFASRLGDWFGLLGSGVGPGLDDKLFYWSDMFHYRRTNEFACDLFRRAVANGYNNDDGRVDKDPSAAFGYEQGVAYALGWMTHIGTDVAGHPFVNEKAGGPYRLHWQRHHLVENHMDGFNCNARQGTDPFYNMFASSALHFWVQFRDEDGDTPLFDYLQGVSSQPFPDPPDEHAPTGPLPQYPTGVTSRDYFKRKLIFDQDSDMPPALAAFLLDTMKDTFYDRHNPASNDQMATHPMILAAITAGADGRPDDELMDANYTLFYKYIKFATTDYWRMPKPQVPDVFPNLSPPIPPEPFNQLAPKLDDTIWENWEYLIFIFTWIVYIAEWIAYVLTVLPAIILDLATYPARIVLYLIEEALYEMYKAFHLLLVMEGFVLPQPDEIDLGLVQLGLPSQGPFTGLLGLMEDIFGGLLGDDVNAPPLNEPVRDPLYPRDTIMDDRTLVQQFEGAFTTLKNDLVPPACPDLQPDPNGKVPSEFLRPWEYPLFNNDGSPVGTEPTPPLVDGVPSATRASFYVAGQLPTALLGQTPGTDAARHAYEAAATPRDTDNLNNTSLNADFNLGDPINYSLYVIDQLTANGVDPGLLASFNLDADRGYGYKCWDWDRRNGYQGIEDHPRPATATVFGVFGGDQNFPYPIMCTPSRQFDKTDLCGNPQAPRTIPLDYNPNTPVAIHYQRLLQTPTDVANGFPKCDVLPPSPPPPIPHSPPPPIPHSPPPPIPIPAASTKTTVKK